MRVITKLTKNGLEKAKQELENIIEVQIPANLKDLKDARAQGDLSENADYHAAREVQGQLHSRMNQLQEIIKNHEIIKGREFTISVNGSKPRTYTIVGTHEADPVNGFISNECPVGKAILSNPNSKIIKTKSESNKELTIEIFS